MNASGAWRVAPGLVWRQFDDADDWVVFHPASGDVHLLTDAAHRLWTILASEPHQSIAQLSGQLASATSAPIDDVVESVRAALEVMDRAGLIVPAERAA